MTSSTSCCQGPSGEIGPPGQQGNPGEQVVHNKRDVLLLITYTCRVIQKAFHIRSRFLNTVVCCRIFFFCLYFNFN